MVRGRIKFPKVIQVNSSAIENTQERIPTEQDCLEPSHEGEQVISTFLNRLSQKCTIDCQYCIRTP